MRGGGEEGSPPWVPLGRGVASIQDNDQADEGEHKLMGLHRLVLLEEDDPSEDRARVHRAILVWARDRGRAYVLKTSGRRVHLLQVTA